MAVKELHATNSVQSNAEMFGEAETLNSLRHPCIIAFYGVVVNQVHMHHLLYSLEIMPTQLYSAGHVYQTVLCTGYVYQIVLSSVLSTSCLPLHHLSHILPSGKAQAQTNWFAHTSHPYCHLCQHVLHGKHPASLLLMY